ncbi:MAG: RNA 2'-phosphotransferase [bacterium]|nr:RNA 2'-phosphotransferase [bacterium]
MTVDPTDHRLVRLSRFLSYVLRHRPDAVGLALDAAGWVEVDALLAACAAHGRPLTRDELEQVVARDDKQRYAFGDDGLRIRASQGHSVAVELGYEPRMPPEILYHGTTERFLEAIRREGLRRGERHHVHLSADEETARRVGARRGRPVVLRVRAGEMARAGTPFFLSANGVWLTEGVGVGFIEEG